MPSSSVVKGTTVSSIGMPMRSSWSTAPASRASIAALGQLDEADAVGHELVRRLPAEVGRVLRLEALPGPRPERPGPREQGRRHGVPAAAGAGVLGREGDEGARVAARRPHPRLVGRPLEQVLGDASLCGHPAYLSDLVSGRQSVVGSRRAGPAGCLVLNLWTEGPASGHDAQPVVVPGVAHLDSARARGARPPGDDRSDPGRLEVAQAREDKVAPGVSESSCLLARPAR